MGLFDKFSKKKQETPKERNEIQNKQLKETLADTALSLLKQGEEYEELAYTKVEFGYVFDIDDHGIESLFKVITDKGTYYFAAQQKSLMRLDFNEALFESTRDTFLELHS